MRKIISTALAGVMLGTTLVASATPALADPNRDRFIERYYVQRGHDDDYWVWRKNRHRWRDDDYRGWYHRHDHDSMMTRSRPASLAWQPERSSVPQ